MVKFSRHKVEMIKNRIVSILGETSDGEMAYTTLRAKLTPIYSGLTSRRIHYHHDGDVKPSWFFGDDAFLDLLEYIGFDVRRKRDARGWILRQYVSVSKRLKP